MPNSYTIADVIEDYESFDGDDLDHFFQTWDHRLFSDKPVRDDIVTIAVDLNVRAAGNLTFSGFDDVTPQSAVPEPGDVVEVVEDESWLSTRAEVVSVDREKRLIYLRVNWGTFAPPRSTSLTTEKIINAYHRYEDDDLDYFISMWDDYLSDMRKFQQ